MTYRAVHRGDVIAEDLRFAGVSPSERARLNIVLPNRVTQILHGRRGITGDTALRLGHWVGTSAQHWLHLQSAYDICMAAQKAGSEIERPPARHSDGGLAG